MRIGDAGDGWPRALERSCTVRLTFSSVVRFNLSLSICRRCSLSVSNLSCGRGRALAQDFSSGPNSSQTTQAQLKSRLFGRTIRSSFGFALQAHAPSSAP